MKIWLGIIFFITLSFAQEIPVDVLLQERYATIPLPDPAIYYGQNEEFVQAIEAAYCDEALTNDLFIGQEGWIFTKRNHVDFGREFLSIKDFSYSEIVFWLNQYRNALEAVGFRDVVIMVVPPKGLLGEPYMTEALRTILNEQNTQADYYTMRLAYLQAGFKHVPDLLRLVKPLFHQHIFAHFPTDHHFTAHSASLWASEAARIIMNTPTYQTLEKTSVNLLLLDEKWQELGWEHIKAVTEICQTTAPTTYFPYYRLEYPDGSPDLLEEVRNEIVVAGNSNIGFEFNRPGSYGDSGGTPGTATADFLAHLTSLPVLKYGVYSLGNSAIEQYLRTDFFSEAPPSYLVQYAEAHSYPYTPYHYRTLSALTYGKCQHPVFETTIQRKGFIKTDLSEALIDGDSANYYWWLELDVPAQKQSNWIVKETYASGLKDALVLDTDDRFMEYPNFFALQLKPRQGQLVSMQITPEPGWDGKNVKLSLCDIRQVTEDYKALGR